MSAKWDKAIETIGGRKFLVFLAGTGLLLAKVITSEQWFWVATLYVGGNVAEGLAQRVTTLFTK